jgi:hypothetical protein
MQTKEQILNEILDIGLHIDCRGNLYGKKYDKFVTKTGGCWQLPEELAGLLYYLQDKNIQSFLNIGTFNGITFNYMADFFNRTSTVNCLTIDPYDFNPKKNTKYQYLNYTSNDLKDQKFDLVFIDGHHSYNFVKDDYYNVGQYAKYTVFHDIEDKFILNQPGYGGGVPKFWNEIKTTRKNLEFIDNEKPVKMMGIGLLYDEI